MLTCCAHRLQSINYPKLFMKLHTIIWDFDGTLLPNDPYDSEQSLMMHKLERAGQNVPFLINALARSLLYADQKEHFRTLFKKFYIWFMKGTPVSDLDRVCGLLAGKISAEDRRTLLQLKTDGHRMLVLSCGTADLSERTLKMAGLGECFEAIVGNKFQIENGKITGMTFEIPDPNDKVTFLRKRGISPDNAIAVGDGYTDIPVLDWARISIMLDRTGKKKALYSHKKYKFISEISEIFTIV